MSWSVIPFSQVKSTREVGEHEYLIYANEIVVCHSEKACGAILELLPTHPLYFLSAHALFRKHISPAQQTYLEVTKKMFVNYTEEGM